VIIVRCPQCGLFNPDTAERCDCGYDFDRKLAPEASAFPHGSRPALVWVITIGVIVSFLCGSVSVSLIVTGAIPVNEPVRAYYQSLTAADWALTVALGLANLSGAVALFLLRKQALYLFVGSLALNLLATIHTLAKLRAAVSSVPGSAVGMFLGLGILLAICLYATKLTRAGVLR